MHSIISCLRVDSEAIRVQGLSNALHAACPAAAATSAAEQLAT